MSSLLVNIGVMMAASLNFVERFLDKYFLELHPVIRNVVYVVILAMGCIGYLSPTHMNAEIYLKVNSSGKPAYYREQPVIVRMNGKDSKFITNSQGVISIPMSSLQVKDVEFHFFRDSDKLDQPTIKKIPLKNKLLGNVRLTYLLDGDDVQINYNENKDALVSGFNFNLIPKAVAGSEVKYLEVEKSDLVELLIKNIKEIKGGQGLDIDQNTFLDSIDFDTLEWTFIMSIIESELGLKIWDITLKKGQSIDEFAKNIILNSSAESLEKSNISVDVIGTGEAESIENLKVYVFDVGSGLCVLIRSPDVQNKYVNLLYDAGEYSHCSQGIKRVLNVGDDIDEVFISHSDSDHYGGLRFFEDDFTIGRITDTGIVRKNGKLLRSTYQNYQNYISNLNVTYRSLINEDIKPGTTWKLGGADLTFLHGLGSPDDEFSKSGENSRARNGASIVIKVEYKGKSILLAGDSVGLGENDLSGAKQCISTERRMLNQLCDLEKDECDVLKSNVLIAPHHGSSESSCIPFIEKVNPDYLIFSAGNMYAHPRKDVYDRYRGVNENIKMYRTDKGEIVDANKLELVELSGVQEFTRLDDNIFIEMGDNGVDVSYLDLRPKIK